MRGTHVRNGSRQRRDTLGKMLRQRQDEVREKLRELRATLPLERAEVRDEEEQRMDEFVRDMDFALLEMESETLLRIDEALMRLEHGSYGICDRCDEPIAEARLRALPFATRCRDCQEREEELGPPVPKRIAYDGDAAA